MTHLFKLELEKIYSYQANLRTGNYGKYFTKKYLNMRSKMIEQLQVQSKKKLDTYCEVGYDFYFPMPKDKKKCKEIIDRCYWHTKIDYDNMVKATQDALEQAGVISNDKLLVKHIGGVNKYHEEDFCLIIIHIKEL